MIISNDFDPEFALIILKSYKRFKIKLIENYQPCINVHVLTLKGTENQLHMLNDFCQSIYYKQPRGVK